MSKKSKKNGASRAPSSTETKAYDLRRDAVERLVTADETAPEVDEKELKKYKKTRFLGIPMWAKALFVKFWFNGAMCYFFVWGLGVYIENKLDLVVVLALAMGMFNSLIVNNVLLFLDDGTDGYSRWIFVPQKFSAKTTSGKIMFSLLAFLLDIIYSFAVVFIVYLIYFGINNKADGAFGVEPITFGILYLAVDLLFIGMKYLMVKIISDAVKKSE